jgi:hypothetical protein
MTSPISLLNKNAVSVYGRNRIADVQSAPALRSGQTQQQTAFGSDPLKFPEDDPTQLIKGIPAEFPAQKQKASSTYRANLPNITYTAIFSPPSTRRASNTNLPPQQTSAGAARAYSQQLEMIAIKEGLFVDLYA